MNLATPEELEKYLAKYPGTESIEILIADQNGYLRGKRLNTSAFEKIFKDGVCLPASVFGLDATGTTVEATGLGFESGDRDMICRPIADTLVPVPWHTNKAQVLMTMETEGGEQFEGNPRQALNRIAGLFGELQMTPVVAVELEFYLLDRQPDPITGLPRPPVSPRTGERQRSTQVYSIENLDDFQEFIDKVMQYAAVQNIPADGVIAEYAPGQFEVNLQHVGDPLVAADQAILLKRIIRQAATELNMKACFMAKPYIDQSGSGMHIHCSLSDQHGAAVFAGQQKLLMNAVAGLLDTLIPAQILMFPTLNSYKRLGQETFAPHAPGWGWDNRTVAIRIPAGEPESLRVEHRVAGADANPYLTVALVLAGIHYGITGNLTPPEPIIGDAYSQLPMELTDSGRTAIRRFKAHSGFSQYFHKDFLTILLAVREADIRLFQQQLTALEIELLLQ